MADRFVLDYPLMHWLLTDARRIAEPKSFLAALADQLIAQGIEVSRLTTGVPILHPQVHSYSARWDSVKGEFVDEPRRAVADADALVGELLDELQELFKQQRTQIEQGLDADETSTEDLRLALRRYRSFFDRLLSI